MPVRKPAGQARQTQPSRKGLVRVLLCAFLGLAPIGTSAALAADALVDAREEQGFGRVVMTFDQLPTFDARVSTGVLVVTFADPIKADLSMVVGSMPGYVTAARRDPDGKAIRMALSRPVTINTMQAGEKLFIDFLPSGWVGYPPSLPRDVIAELNRKIRDARKAEATIRTLKQRTYDPLTLEVGSTPTFTRLVFGLNTPIPARHERAGDKVTLWIDAPIPFDTNEAVGMIPPEMTNLAAASTADGLTITFDLDSDIDLRGFREGDNYILDLTPPEKAVARPIVPDSILNAAESAISPVPVETMKTDVVPANGAAASVPLPSPRPVHAARTTEPAASTEAATQIVAAPAHESATVEKAPQVAADRSLSESPVVTPEPESPVTERPAATVTASPAVSKPASEPVAQLAANASAPSVRRVRDIMEIVIPFDQRPPAAVFMRGSTLWMVFDSDEAFDLGFLVDDTGGLVTDVSQERSGPSHIIRLALSESRLISVIADGSSWVIALGDTVVEPARPIYLSSGYAGDGRSAVKTTLESIGGVRWLEDPDVGDRLAVVTLQGPPRAIVRGHAFVEFRALSTAHGMALQAVADDLSVTAGLVDVIVTRDGGLTLSNWERPAHEQPMRYVSRTPELNAGPFQSTLWNAALAKPYLAGADEEMRLAAAASPEEKGTARMSLARFQLAHGNAAEAKAVLDVMRAEDRSLANRSDISMMYGAALVKLGRNEEALKVLERGDVNDLRQTQLWKSVAEARLGRLSRSREAYRKGEPALNTMPEALQALFRETAAQVAIDSRDYSTAAIELDAVDAIGPEDGSWRRTVLRARIADGLGQTASALEGYRVAMSGDDAIAAAEARYRSTKLRLAKGEVAHAEALRDLELMSVGWRGDNIEADVLATLGELYTADKRWRDAFEVMRTAVTLYPNAEVTRTLQQTMSDRFADIFLANGEKIETLDALALFLDFKELTPPGRRGDEIIRRLADRMVEVDLLQEGADLLEYQIDNRLAGAARAQVAARAAVIHLLNQKPARAYKVLQATRLAGLPTELRRSRTLLEAKALAEIGRPDVAIELVDSLDGSDALLMKADILWKDRRWQEAGEGLELLLGTRWRENTSLDDEERMNVLRAGIGYAMAEDSLGLERLRVKYAGLMANSPDGRAFDTITAPIDARGEAFTELARSIAATDTFTGFLAEYRKRHPEVAGPLEGTPAFAPDASALPVPQAEAAAQTAARS